MADRINDTKVEYQHVSAEEAGPDALSDTTDNANLSGRDHSPVHRSWLQTGLLQIVTILWLVPIAILLWFNFSGWVIGASAWCPKGDCYRSLYSSDSDERAARFDKNDHNVVGGLQFVAKALEAWFVFIAASLLYIVTMASAGHREGLPIGYLTKPLNFATTVTVTSWLPWSNGATSGQQKTAAGARYQRRLWGLILLSVFLFVLCALMGPATAVLAIPTLQWIETEKYGVRKLVHVNSDLPPRNDTNSWFYRWTTDCNQTQYENAQFLCTYLPFGQSLDAWAQGWLGSNGRVPGIASQDDLSFRLNETVPSPETSESPGSSYGYIWWTPNRQIISNLSTDYLNLKYIGSGANEAQVKYANEVANDYQGVFPDPFETYTDYNRSLELEVRRNGPIIGAISNMWFDYDPHSRLIRSQIDPYRQVRCYKDYNLFWTPGARNSSQGLFTKCVRSGGGWGAPNNQWRQFSIDGRVNPDTQQIGSNTTVRILSSDKAVFLPNNELPDGFDPACMTIGFIPNNTVCDWDRFFTVDEQDPMYNRTQNLVTIEYAMQIGNSSLVVAVDFAAFLAFTEYVFDPSPIANPMRLVQTDTLPKVATQDTRPLFVDPTWVLAGWSASNNSRIYNRPMTNNLALLLETMLSNRAAGFDQIGSTFLDVVLGLPVMNSLSLIDHSTIEVSGPVAQGDMDRWQPMLQRYGRIFVWSYSMTSRTSMLGAVVVLLGCIVVVAQAVLGFVDRRPHRSPTQLLVAALEHTPRGEFDGKSHKEKELAAARFRVRDDSSRAGKFSFYEPGS